MAWVGSGCAHCTFGKLSCKGYRQGRHVPLTDSHENDSCSPAPLHARCHINRGSGQHGQAHSLCGRHAVVGQSRAAAWRKGGKREAEGEAYGRVSVCCDLLPTFGRLREAGLLCSPLFTLAAASSRVADRSMLIWYSCASERRVFGWQGSTRAHGGLQAAGSAPCLHPASFMHSTARRPLAHCTPVSPSHSRLPAG